MRAGHVAEGAGLDFLLRAIRRLFLILGLVFILRFLIILGLLIVRARLSASEPEPLPLSEPLPCAISAGSE